MIFCKEEGLFVAPLKHLPSEIICAPMFSWIPYIAQATTRARGKVKSVQLPDGRINLVTKCSHLLALGDHSMLVIPTDVAR